MHEYGITLAAGQLTLRKIRAANAGTVSLFGLVRKSGLAPSLPNAVAASTNYGSAPPSLSSATHLDDDFSAGNSGAKTNSMASGANSSSPNSPLLTLVVELVLFGAAIVSALLLWEYVFSGSQSGPALPDWTSVNKNNADVSAGGGETVPLQR
jgi:hypothetical protein